MAESYRDVLVDQLRTLFGLNDVQSERLATTILLAAQEDKELGYGGRASTVSNPPTKE